MQIVRYQKVGKDKYKIFLDNPERMQRELFDKEDI